MKEPSEFANKIYSNLKKVPLGKVTTYSELAKSVDNKAYQAIGQVMRNNPFAPIVPCHRVVKSDGSLGGFMGKTEGKEIDKKIKLLRSEGVEIRNGKILNFQNKVYKF